MPRKRASSSLDLDFRPVGYWGRPGSLLANVKGQMRRDILREELGTGRGADIPGALAHESLPEALREAQGRLHPSMMGGEYLPDSLTNEVEIARICLESTTGDVFSIRARPRARGILYRVVDEYGEGHDYGLRPKSSQRPLSLGQMIRLLDCISLPGVGKDGVIGFLEDQLECGVDLETLESFLHVESEFYPQLEGHYEREIERWAEREGGRAGEDEPDDDDWDEEGSDD